MGMWISTGGYWLFVYFLVVKPGYCPFHIHKTCLNGTSTCNSDEECAEDEKCCQTACKSKVCRKSIEKLGIIYYATISDYFIWS